MLAKLVWSLKQLLPLKYKSRMRRDGMIYNCQWRMWMGRAFHIDMERVK